MFSLLSLTVGRLSEADGGVGNSICRIDLHSVDNSITSLCISTKSLLDFYKIVIYKLFQLKSHLFVRV